jgi:hypothetical protein
MIWSITDFETELVRGTRERWTEWRFRGFLERGTE